MCRKGSRRVQSADGAHAKAQATRILTLANAQNTQNSKHGRK